MFLKKEERYGKEFVVEGMDIGVGFKCMLGM